MSVVHGIHTPIPRLRRRIIINKPTISSQRCVKINKMISVKVPELLKRRIHHTMCYYVV